MSDLTLTPSEGAPPGFPFLEKTARQKIGIAKKEARTLRYAHLQEEVDWCLRHKNIWLAQSGVDGLLKAKALGLDTLRPSAQTANGSDGGALKAAMPPPANVKKTAVQKAEGPVTLRVVRATMNPHILLCCPRDDDALQPKTTLRVRVQSTVNFRRFMEIPATLVAGYTDLYDMARACPKNPGKW